MFISNSQEILKEFDGWSAFVNTIKFFDIHLFIIITITSIFFLFTTVTVFLNKDSRTNDSKIISAFNELCFLLSCSTFGTVTAYFLSLELKRGDNGSSSNGLISSFVAPFISLLTAISLLFASRIKSGGSESAKPVLYAACFLCSVAISYRTFFYQVLTAF